MPIWNEWLALLAVLSLSVRTGGGGRAWAIENACLFGLALSKCLAHALVGGPPALYLVFGITNAFLVEGCVVLIGLLNVSAYRSMPSYHDRAPGHTKREAFEGALWCTLPVHVISSVMAYAACDPAMCEATWSSVDPWNDLVTFSPVRYLWMFSLFRVVSDVVFYTTHRLQHRFVYSRLHARHHSHRRPTLLTNFCFTAADLFLEGSLPSACAGLVLHQVLGHAPSPLEFSLCLASIQWYQIGSHNDKALPCITAFPLLAPVYNHPRVKQWTRPRTLQVHDHVRFHGAHHKRVAGNYGISPYLDWMLGTHVGEA